MALNGDFWNGTSAGTNVSVYQPLTNALQPFIALGSIGSGANERDVRMMRERTPLEWLRAEIEEVCFLARAA